MTKRVLYNLLRNGESLDGIGILTEDEEACILHCKPFTILPVDDTELWDHIAYIPCAYHNEIPAFEENLDADQITQVLEHCYTVKDFIKMAGGNKILAISLYEFTDWEIPDVKQMVEMFRDDGFEDLYGVKKETVLQIA